MQNKFELLEKFSDYLNTEENKAKRSNLEP